MPNKPARPCRRCGQPTHDTYCDECQASKSDDRRSAAKRGYDRRWQVLRARKLAVDPLCECDRCTSAGRTTPADTVHHIKPVDDYPELRLAWSNLLSMARVCHEREHGRIKRKTKHTSLSCSRGRMPRVNTGASNADRK